MGGRGTVMNREFFGPTWESSNPAQQARRRMSNYYGEGDYKDVLRWGSRGLGAIAGGAMGYMSGGAAGGATGSVAGYNKGADFSKYMGWGDYENAGGQSGNQLIGGAGPQQQISVNQSDNSGDVYITHTEFITNVVVNTGAGTASPFEITSYDINPGLDFTFPFLAQMAQNYVLYDFEGLMFQYKPTSGESGGSGNSLGKVILATQYDPDAPAFFNAIQMENYDYANSTKPAMGAVHGVETAHSTGATNMLYTRTGSSTKSKIFTDIGTFYVATEGIPGLAAAAVQTIGEIWVTYRVRLSRANLYGSLIGGNVSSSALTAGGSALLSFVAGTQVNKVSNSFNVTLANVSNTAFRIEFPTKISLGSFMICIQSTETAGSVINYTSPSAGSNLVFWRPMVTLPQAAGTHVAAPATGVAANVSLIDLVWVTISAPGNAFGSLQINHNVAHAGSTTYNIFISEVAQIPYTTLL